MRKSQIDVLVAAEKHKRTATLRRKVSVLSDIIDDREQCKRMYFWSPDGSSSGRRSAEKRLSEDYGTEVGGMAIRYVRDVSMSCRYVYAKDYLWGVMDGEEVNITLADVKKLIDGINAILSKRTAKAV